MYSGKIGETGRLDLKMFQTCKFRGYLGLNILCPLSSHHGRHHHLRQFIHNPESCLRWSPDGLALAVATFFCETSCQSMVKVGGRRGPSHFWTISKVLTKACVPNCHHSIHGQGRRQTQTVNIYKHIYDRSLGPIRGPTSSWRPFGPA